MKSVFIVLGVVFALGFLLYLFVGSSSVSLLSVPLNFDTGSNKNSGSQSETGRIVTEQTEE